MYSPRNCDVDRIWHYVFDKQIGTPNQFCAPVTKVLKNVTHPLMVAFHNPCKLKRISKCLRVSVSTNCLCDSLCFIIRETNLKSHLVTMHNFLKSSHLTFWRYVSPAKPMVVSLHDSESNEQCCTAVAQILTNTSRHCIPVTMALHNMCLLILVLLYLSRTIASLNKVSRHRF